MTRRGEIHTDPPAAGYDDTPGALNIVDTPEHDMAEDGYRAAWWMLAAFIVIHSAIAAAAFFVHSLVAATCG